MNKSVVTIAVVAAVAIGIVVGVIGTTGAFTSPTPSNTVSAGTQTDVGQLNTNPALTGSVTIDGSSTVYPITEVIAEKFSDAYPGVKTTVAVSGTGGGFKRFTVGETDINDSSRPITDSEKAAAATNSIRWLEIPIGLEGLTIVVHPDNNLLPGDCISVEELREMWKPERTVTSWNHLDPSYPDEEIRLYGAGPDSGTFDYFTERVVGTARSSTTDYIPSEDDNVLVQGVSNDRYSLGYIPEAYVAEAGDRLKKIAVSETKGGECVFPEAETITSGSYPLSRPLFIHVDYDKLQTRPELKAFVEFYLSNAKDAVRQVQYVTLPDNYYNAALEKIRAGEYSPDDNTTFRELY
jgi:phosphate transport system substrate-binding protein